jgi:hypothetical protein
MSALGVEGECKVSEIQKRRRGDEFIREETAKFTPAFLSIGDVNGGKCLHKSPFDSTLTDVC